MAAMRIADNRYLLAFKPIHDSRGTDNRPVRWVNGDTVVAMSFDRMGRRVTKNAQRFVYDGYLQIADNGGNAYVWDITENVATRPLVWNRGGEVSYYAHDGNKNVSDVVASNGDIVAHYDYAPFGAVVSHSGALADANHFGFSSEYADRDLGLVYYNYRHYDPVTGRWLSRDPIEERGGIALYGFVGHRVQMWFDRLGRGFLSSCKKIDGPHKKEGAEWVVDKVIFIPFEKGVLDDGLTAAGQTWYGEFQIEWSLAGEATCCCRNFITRKTWIKKADTKKYWTSDKIAFDPTLGDIIGVSPNILPLTVPSPISILQGGGEVLAALLSKFFGNIGGLEPDSSAPTAAGQVAAGINSTRPKNDGPGDWKPADPCKKL